MVLNARAKASVIIVNWNGRELLRRCLQYIQEQSFADYEVLVVDNGSSDGSCEMVSAYFPKIRLLRNEKNLGFATATNRGIEASDSEFVVTLNNDAYPDPQWLGKLVAAAEADNRIGMCASKISLDSRPEIIDSAGIQVNKAGIATNCLAGEKDADTTYELKAVFGPSASAALYRRKMLEEIGPFDDDFFAYYEDVDLAWRGRLAGWECTFVPLARVLHAHSATGQRVAGFKTYLLSRNRLWSIMKNYPSPYFARALPLIIAYDILTLLGNYVAYRNLAPLRGRMAALRGANRMWERRRLIQQRLATEENKKRVWEMMAPAPKPWELWAQERRWHSYF